MKKPHLIAKEVFKTRGHWIEENRRAHSSKFICSECGGIAYYVQSLRDPNWYKCCGYKYCPHCGKPMIIA